MYILRGHFYSLEVGCSRTPPLLTFRKSPSAGDPEGGDAAAHQNDCICLLHIHMCIYIKLKKLIDDVLNKLKELSNDENTTSKLNNYLRVFIRIINAYTSKEYTYVPWKTICLIVAGLIYFIYPVDLIPDFIPVSGLIDDVAFIAWIYDSIKEDIDKFLEWEKSSKE